MTDHIIPTNIVLGRSWLFNHPTGKRWFKYEIESGEYDETLDKQNKQIVYLLIYKNQKESGLWPYTAEVEYRLKFEIGLNSRLWPQLEKDQLLIVEWWYNL